MLAQILHDLYVPKELLDGLTEDQKQILFCKMREEQVRRYHEREEEAAQVVTKNKKKKKKQVTFLLGPDGHECCWTEGEPKPSMIEIHRQNQSSRILGNSNPTHHDERKQIEEISSNIQDARRIFERLESDTRRLVLNQSTDLVDEHFHREVEERSKKAEQERREIARRARDHFHRNSLQLNVCFDTDNHTSMIFQPPPLNLSNKNTNEKQIHIELIKRKSPIGSDSPVHILKIEEEEDAPLRIVEDQRSKPLLPLTREDIRQWFCTKEIPYRTFRSPTGQIYPWFHGIISRAYTEQLLSSKPVGSYLIRINEKIFGYALSYRASDHCRHLLIEVIVSSKKADHSHAYRFLGGAKHELFTQLNQLIDKYSNTPIRANSTDVLRYPCGQIEGEKPDYADLFLEPNKQYESLYISLENTTSPSSTTHL